MHIVLHPLVTMTLVGKGQGRLSLGTKAFLALQVEAAVRIPQAPAGHQANRQSGFPAVGSKDCKMTSHASGEGGEGRS